jgi:hypothetical protein
MTTLHKRITTMTSSTKSIQSEENYYKDDNLGPKNRHPPGSAYPNMIFLCEKHDKTKMNGVARLYQDIIQYSLSGEYNKLQQEEQREGFKITDIGNWLLDYNHDYVNYYTDSKAKTRGEKKLSHVSNRIKRYLDNLEKWGLILKI